MDLRISDQAHDSDPRLDGPCTNKKVAQTSSPRLARIIMMPIAMDVMKKDAQSSSPRQDVKRRSGLPSVASFIPPCQERPPL
jgi:hypothetical protein